MQIKQKFSDGRGCPNTNANTIGREIAIIAPPAESFAAGANAFRVWGESRNYNFQSETPNGWPESRKVRVGDKTAEIARKSRLYYKQLIERVEDESNGSCSRP